LLGEYKELGRSRFDPYRPRRVQSRNPLPRRRNGGCHNNRDISQAYLLPKIPEQTLVSRMKVLTFSIDGAAPRLGAWVDGDILDLTAAAGAVEKTKDFPTSLKALIEQGPSVIARARRVVDAAGSFKRGDGVRFERSSATLLPPIPDPGKFLCVGKNNKSHLEELARNQLIKEIPKEPTGFIKLNSVLVGDGARVARPVGITMFDYEPELAFVIGKRAFGVRKDDAMSHVVGITLINDLTAREIQKREVASGTRFWTSKNMPGFGPVGPFMITIDEIADPHDLWVTCMVNGKQRMRTHTGDVIFRIGDVIEHFSRWMPFEPGDLIAMGAPAGVAVGQPNADELYLRPGDVVDIAFEGLPALRTHITEPTEKRS
jgi:2-keto-4-pentenoate hydratase/2-oxohepta-3-ene-1,7-dioic acid hydratase in catechol pathway